MAKRSSKGKKGGLSKIKMKNIKGGKMSKGKKTGSKEVSMARKKLLAIRKLKEKRKASGNIHRKVPEKEIDPEDVLDMVDAEDLLNLRNKSLKSKFYFINEADTNGSKQGEVKKRRKHRDEDDEDKLENYYENKRSRELNDEKKLKVLLPIKTKKGIEMQTIETNGISDDDEEVDENENNEEEGGDHDDENVDDEDEKPELDETLEENGHPFTKDILLEKRKQKLEESKLRIGLLSASFLEDPENRLRNLDYLLTMIEKPNSSVAYTIPKLVALSLLAVFQDILPLYPIKHHNIEGDRLKKLTRELQGYEANLLRRYRLYLQKLEKLATVIPKKRVTQIASEGAYKLALVSLDCMCKMLITHPYFNLSSNIVNFVINYLNHWDPEVRSIVSTSIKSVFRKDKRGEMSYEIVKRINALIKSKLNQTLIRRDVIDVLLVLRIKEANLEKEQQHEMKSEGKVTFEQRRMLSKKQRKKAKELVQLERELLEASAEENKGRKTHFLREITKLVFTVYFRALKSNSKDILSAVLEGLGKFAHVINLEFFDDLLKSLEKLLREGELKDRQILLCVCTVLAVLDGQGAALTLDPTIFHKYLYKALFSLKSGQLKSNTDIAVRSLRLATGRKKIPGPRAASFVKRIATVSLQVEHQDVLAILSELKNVLRLNPATACLMNPDESSASSVYLPELDDPDHACAQSSTLWELTSLISHYHPWVCQLTRGMLYPEKLEKLPTDVTKNSSEEIANILDPIPSMQFKPPLLKNSIVQKSTSTSSSSSSKNKAQFLNLKTEYFNNSDQATQINNLTTGGSKNKKIDYFSSSIK